MMQSRAKAIAMVHLSDIPPLVEIATAASRRPSWFTRFLAALHESRRDTARQIIAQHGHLIHPNPDWAS